MIRTHPWPKGGAPQLGVGGPGLPAPFGIWPADDHPGDEDQEHELIADRTRETST
ncbi:hypothetical protein AB0B01_17105 [Streptomyces sp. NPDC044571]|uniref:hypothetical protein n=1 Tax=Streptomyces sp. NPDC044571 TaxID=3155371 RepID=UPI0033F2D804